MLYYAIRWLLFFLVGIPCQILAYFIYPFLVAYYWLWVKTRKKVPHLEIPSMRHSIVQLMQAAEQETPRDKYYVNTEDAHTAIEHMFLWKLKPELAAPALKDLMYPNGSLKRKSPTDSNTPVSGDCLSSWVLSYVLYGGNKEDLKKLAKHYLKNCLGLGSWADNWKVSNRSDNSGVNYSFDSVFYCINQPALAPQYFTSAALLMLAATELGGFWKLVYRLHFFLMGGWLFNLAPFVTYREDEHYYVQHVTLMNLCTMYKLCVKYEYSGKAIYKYGINYLLKHCSPGNNIQPMMIALAVEVNAIDKQLRDQAIKALTVTKFVWPQHNPNTHLFWDYDSHIMIYSISAGAAKMLLDKVDLGERLALNAYIEHLNTD
jgi:hypothetical protein